MINAEYINKVENVYIDGASSVFNIESLDRFDGDQYDIYDQKDYARMLKDIETVCRTSFEYRQLIAYLRNTEGMNTCSFLGNVTNVDNTKVKIEIHHSPFTLFSIVEAVTKKRLHNNESVDIFDISKEVMLLHYMGYVGLIPLSATVHEMVHNGYIFIPLNLPRGNWEKFVELYYDYISPADLDALDSAREMTTEWLEDISKENNIVDTQQQLFNLHTTYIKYNNIDINTKAHDAKNDIKDSIEEIKTKKKSMMKVDYNHRGGPITDFLNGLN